LIYEYTCAVFLLVFLVVVSLVRVRGVNCLQDSPMDSYVIRFLLILIIVLLRVAPFNSLYTFASADGRNLQGTLAFASVGRAHYAFDIYTLPLQPLRFSTNLEETLVTDGESVNHNGQYLQGPGIQTLMHRLNINTTSTPVENVMAFVSERDGFPELYLNIYLKDNLPLLAEKAEENSRREALEDGKRCLTINFGGVFEEKGKKDVPDLSMKDRPSMAGNSMVYVSTRGQTKASRKSWAAVYSTSIKTGRTRRLTPDGIADLSPAVSPSGEWVMAASAGERGWQGEIHDLETDLYVFRASDGSGRRLVVKHGGWPSWADDNTVFFHRQAEDGWWSVYRASVNSSSALVERITPPGIDAFTPAASRTGPWIAVATRRPGHDYRHIEIFDLLKKIHPSDQVGFSQFSPLQSLCFF